MKPFLLPLAVAGCLLLLAGCATPTARIRANPQLFAAVPPADRALVEKGVVREGMNKDSVYLAWGRPDGIRRALDPRGQLESWVYLDTNLVPVSGFGYAGYAGPYGGRCGRGYYAPIYPSFDYVPVRQFGRSVTFVSGRVVSWEAPVR